MKSQAIKTRLVKPGDAINEVIIESIETLAEKSVLVVASKIFSFCENRLVPKKSGDKNEKWDLAKQEADLWLHPDESIYQCMLTIKGNWMFANAGIDESNAGGENFVLWPIKPQQSVNRVWQFLRQHYGVSEVGVIMSDSRSMPLNWGVVGHGIAYCGFEPLYSYIDQPDLFGRKMQMERTSVVQSLVTVGTLVMGEGNEMTPMAVINDIPRIKFVDHEPTDAEIKALMPNLKDDIYAPLLNRAPWNKGGGGTA
jgi:F420-0:gamma-glutamyl ligase